MTRYGLTPRAQADLTEIWDYTRDHWGIQQAEFYIRQIKACIESVADDPGLGRCCEHIRPGYHTYPAGSHVLFYRATATGIAVIRILHQRMDFRRHLQG